MERRKEGKGWETFLEHWGWLILVTVIGLATSQIFSFFGKLTGTPWIYFFVASAVLLFSGAGLILYAKLPVYRRGRFFTFGVKSIPESLAGYYLWGWCIFLLGLVLSLCLWHSRR